MNNFFDFPDENFESQLFQLEKGFRNGTHKLDDLGSILPASLMVHHLEDLKPAGINYMNNWGCERMGTSVEELNVLGDAYYDRYFIKEESAIIFDKIAGFLMSGEFDKQCNFFQRVKLHDSKEYRWFFTVCKIIRMKTDIGTFDKMVMLSSPLEGADLMTMKMKRLLEEDLFLKNNYRHFASLTKREKKIITMTANGKSSKEMAEELFISVHTINTHRKNINRKTDCRTFAALVKFALAFDLV